MEYYYPNEKIVAFITARWNRIQERLHQRPKHLRSKFDYEESTETPDFPDQTRLKLILDVIYHASLLIEESRRIAVRVAYLPLGISEEKDTYHLENKPIALETPVNFTVSEVMRLAPALDATRSMILVCPGKSIPSKIISLLRWNLAIIAGVSAGVEEEAAIW